MKNLKFILLFALSIAMLLAK